MAAIRISLRLIADCGTRRKKFLKSALSIKRNTEKIRKRTEVLDGGKEFLQQLYNSIIHKKGVAHYVDIIYSSFGYHRHFCICTAGM
jgi:hypothetical protein